MSNDPEVQRLPVGVRIFIGLYTLVAFSYLIRLLPTLYMLATGDFSNTVTIYNSYAENYYFFVLCALMALLKTIIPLSSALLLFRRRRWGYRVIWGQLLIPFVPENIILVFHAVYFSRKNVRELFS